MEQQMKSCAKCGERNFFDAQFCLACGTPLAAQTFAPPVKKKSSGLVIIMVIFGVMLGGCVIFGMFAAMIGANKTQTSPSALNSRSASPAPDASPTPDNQLVVVKASWEKGGFGSIAIWRVTFKNNTDRPIGDIKYRTAYYSETGNQVDRGGVDALLDKNTVQKVIPPKSTRTIEINDGFTHSEAHRAGFELVSWRFVSDSR